jgi:hypothetical protein
MGLRLPRFTACILIVASLPIGSSRTFPCRPLVAQTMISVMIAPHPAGWRDLPAWPIKGGSYSSPPNVRCAGGALRLPSCADEETG